MQWVLTADRGALEAPRRTLIKTQGNRRFAGRQSHCLANQVVKPSGQTATDTKTRILDAADEIFVRRRIDGARMQEIADQAGVNKALLHYHFRSKADLARAV